MLSFYDRDSFTALSNSTNQIRSGSAKIKIVCKAPQYRYLKLLQY